MLSARRASESLRNSKMSGLVVLDPPPKVLDFAAMAFRLKPSSFGFLSRSRRNTWTLFLVCRSQQVSQTSDCGFPIARLATRFLGFDNDNAVGVDAMIAEFQEPLLQSRGQARTRGRIEAQVNGRSDLVDMLAARTT